MRRQRATPELDTGEASYLYDPKLVRAFPTLLKKEHLSYPTAAYHSTLLPRYPENGMRACSINTIFKKKERNHDGKYSKERNAEHTED